MSTPPASSPSLEHFIRAFHISLIRAFVRNGKKKVVAIFVAAMTSRFKSY
jgi:hypothetical protein